MGALICCAAGGALRAAACGEALADPRGLWETGGGKSHVRLAACEDNKRQLCRTILWMKNPRKDVKNDDQSLRSRELVGPEWSVASRKRVAWRGCCSACNCDPAQYQANSIAYHADRRATHVPNNNSGLGGPCGDGLDRNWPRHDRTGPLHRGLGGSGWRRDTRRRQRFGIHGKPARRVLRAHR